MRICIIAINYAPELTGCAPYTKDLAISLVELGHEVTVICGLPHYPEWRVPKEYSKTLHIRQEMDGVVVRRFWHFVPSKQTAIRRAMYELSFMIHVLIRVRRIDCDRVLAVSPSLFSISLGIILKPKKIKLYVLVQDLMASAVTQSKIPGGSRLRGIVAWIEKRLLLKANSIGIISNTFIPIVLGYGVERSKLILSPNYALNHVQPMIQSECRRILNWKSEDKIVMYTGNMGLKQELDNLIEAARITQWVNPEIKYFLIGDGSRRELLTELSKDLPNVQFFDLVPNDQYSLVLGASDLLLIHEGAMIKDMSVPSKLNSYLCSQRPIIVSCSNESGTYQEVLKNGLIHCKSGDPKALANLIVESLNHVADLPRSKLQNRELHRQARVDWLTEAN